LSHPTAGEYLREKLIQISPGLPLTNIVVERPVVNQAEYDLIIEKLARNKTNAKRNGKRDYLLRA